MTKIRVGLGLAAALAAVLVVACGDGEPGHAAAEPERVQATVAAVEDTAVSDRIEVRGVVHAAREAVVSGRVSGPVTAVMAGAGDTVSNGEPLLRIEPDTSRGQVGQARGALASAQAALAVAEKNFHRYERLAADDAASDAELDSARMEYERAQGAVQQAEGALEAATAVAGDAVVRAPFAARVVERMVDVGDLAVPGRPLVRLESAAGRELWLTVREADIDRVHEGQMLDVSLDSQPELGTIQGVVSEIVPTADSATHTFLVKVDLEGAEPRAGTSGRAYIPGGSVRRLIVPASAVHERGGLELVVVVADDGTSRTRAVTTGRELADGRVEILSGLDAGDTIVVDVAAPVADGTIIEARS